MRFYAAELIAPPPVAIDAGIRLKAFATILKRDQWVAKKLANGPDFPIYLDGSVWLRIGRQVIRHTTAQQLAGTIRRLQGERIREAKALETWPTEEEEGEGE